MLARGAWRPARGGIHLAEWAAELVGTAILLLGGLSAVCLDFGSNSPVAPVLPSVSARLLLTGVLFAGSGVLVTLSPIGRRSGAHLNPAVTLAFWLTGHVHPHDLVGYVGAQLAGAIIGASVVAFAWSSTASSVHLGLTQPGSGVSEAAAAAIEAAMTCLLVVTILVFVSTPATMRWTPAAVWVVVSVLVWQGASLTGTSLNPARSTGPAVVVGDVHALWVYVAGPLLGTSLAVAVRRLALPGLVPLTAKLYHAHGDTGTNLGHFAMAAQSEPEVALTAGRTGSRQRDSARAAGAAGDGPPPRVAASGAAADVRCPGG